MSDASPPWHALDHDAVVARVGTSVAAGLTEDEAVARREAAGPNALAAAARTPWWEMLRRQVAQPLVAVLAVAAAISVAVGEAFDAVTVGAILLLNTVLGFVQEYRADRAIAALQAMLVPRCRVVRDGAIQVRDAADLVVGDVVVLHGGDRVPADLRLVEARGIRADESALTGESVPVAKDVAAVAADAPMAEHRSVLHAGTALTEGMGRGVVVAIGSGTAFGRIATLTGEVIREDTPLQRRLARLGRQLGVLAIVVSVALAALGVATGRSLAEMALTSISLAVAVVPEGLPAVVTVTLALGIRKMVRHGVLLRRMAAAEALGAATVVCTDKTGTLTANAMTVVRVWVGDGAYTVDGVGVRPEGAIHRDGVPADPLPDGLARLVDTASRCHHAALEGPPDDPRGVGDPTEVALVVLAAKAGLTTPAQDVVAEHAFSSARKRMARVVSEGDGRAVHAKGAPEVVVPQCSAVWGAQGPTPLDAAGRAAWEALRRDAASDGLRVLAIAWRALPDTVDADDADAVERDLVLLGFVGIQDPPRPEVAQAVAEAHAAGIRVIVITGDAAETASAVARQVGIDAGTVIQGAELVARGPDGIVAALAGDAVVARATPEHKLRIVEALQGAGDLVAMTGDGVNDAPALKRADVGVAMGLRGTDVARGAADVVLTDDHFASIVHGVKEGRRQHDVIRKFVRYLLTSNAGEVLAIAGGLLLGGPMVLLPVHILWMNLVTDGLTALTLGLERSEPDTMQRPPRDPAAPLLDTRAFLVVGAVGVYLAVAALWLFTTRLGSGSPAEVLHAQTVAFTGLVVLEKANVFNFRSLHLPLARIGVASNPWLLVAVVATLGLQAAAVTVPALQGVLHTTTPTWVDLRDMLLWAVPLFVVPEAVKAWRTR